MICKKAFTRHMRAIPGCSHHLRTIQWPLASLEQSHSVAQSFHELTHNHTTTYNMHYETSVMPYNVTTVCTVHITHTTYMYMYSLTCAPNMSSVSCLLIRAHSLCLPYWIWTSQCKFSIHFTYCTSKKNWDEAKQAPHRSWQWPQRLE